MARFEGVLEPGRFRIVMPLDEPSDLLDRLIVHELTHQFQYDIVPTSIDLMYVRDAAVSDIVARMSALQGYGSFSNPRVIYNLGHAA
ncbi:MAG TPA: hypothetical protein VMO26_13720 [Vicinamibacterales bacterium]|nr:hypothetical protein [Vicinamibacterales bacterium]